MKKIAIYGGSFDPPHMGHKALAENLAAACSAEKVIVVPTAMSPFKNKSGASAEDRLEMCRLTFSEDLFTVSDIEINRGGKSYTVDTVRAIRELYPDSQLYLFMGDDMLLSFHRWYEYRTIMSMCTLVAACRTEDLAELDAMREYSRQALGCDDTGVIICSNVPVEISSTLIRNQLGEQGESNMLLPQVNAYIKSRGLYRE